MNTVRTMIELTEEEARAFVDALDGNTQAPANVYHAACIAIADALAEVLPRPLNVGARVRFGNEIGAMTYEVCAIDGTAAWLKHYDGRHSTALLADLVRARVSDDCAWVHDVCSGEGGRCAIYGTAPASMFDDNDLLVAFEVIRELRAEVQRLGLREIGLLAAVARLSGAS